MGWAASRKFSAEGLGSFQKCRIDAPGGDYNFPINIMGRSAAGPAEGRSVIEGVREDRKSRLSRL